MITKENITITETTEKTADIEIKEGLYTDLKDNTFHCIIYHGGEKIHLQSNVSELWGDLASTQKAIVKAWYVKAVTQTVNKQEGINLTEAEVSDRILQ